MQRRDLVVLLISVLAVAGAVMMAGAEEGTWTGEVIDVACYVPQGAKGAEHAGCAKACVKNGQPMGLLLADKTVVLLAADHQDGAAFEALKGMAGGKAAVSGVLAEKGGMKVLTVTSARAAG